MCASLHANIQPYVPVFHPRAIPCNASYSRQCCMYVNVPACKGHSIEAAQATAFTRRRQNFEIHSSAPYDSLTAPDSC